MKIPPPARAGDELTCDAGPWDAAGCARTDIDGWELRAGGAHPGERAVVRVDAVSRGAPVLFGHWIRTEAPGPIKRRKSPCGIHVRCGGCPIITAGEGQFDAKVASSRSTLPAALADVLAERDAWIESRAGLGYRHKAVLLPSWSRGRLKLGGFARGTHEVVDHARCSVLAPSLLRAGAALHRRLEPVLASGRGAVHPPGDPGPSDALRSLVLRGNRQGQVLATAVGWSEAARPWLEDALSDAVGDGLDGVHFQAFGAPGDRVQGPDPTERLAGAGTLKEIVGDVELTLRPLAFFQANPAVLEGMAAELRARLPGRGTLLDLYCGGGSLGLSLAAGNPGLRLVGVERDTRALASAGKDARRLGVDADWLEGTPEERCAGLGAPEAAVLDPPRAGASPAALAALIALGPQHIAYVACHGPSLARDAQRLMEAGYVPRRLVPADMLPQTPHVEWIAYFERE